EVRAQLERVGAGLLDLDQERLPDRGRVGVALVQRRRVDHRIRIRDLASERLAHAQNRWLAAPVLRQAESEHEQGRQHGLLERSQDSPTSSGGPYGSSPDSAKAKATPAGTRALSCAAWQLSSTTFPATGPRPSPRELASTSCATATRPG